MSLHFTAAANLQRVHHLILLLVLLLIIGFVLFTTLYWVFIALFFLTFFYFLLRAALQDFYRSKQLQDTPIAGIGSAAQGYVQLCGHLALTQDEQQPRAPLSEHPCHYWSLTLRLVRGKKNWSNQAEARSANFFLPFADASGQGYILHRMAKIQGQTAHRTLHDPKDLTSYLHFFSADQQERLTRMQLPQDGVLELHETYLPADRPLFATGFLQTQPTHHNPFVMQASTTSNQPHISSWLSTAMQQMQGINHEAALQWQAEVKRQPKKEQVHILTSPEASLSQRTPYPLLLSDRDLAELIHYHRRRAVLWLTTSGVPLLLLLGFVMFSATASG